MSNLDLTPRRKPRHTMMEAIQQARAQQAKRNAEEAKTPLAPRIEALLKKADPTASQKATDRPTAPALLSGDALVARIRAMALAGVLDPRLPAGELVGHTRAASLADLMAAMKAAGYVEVLRGLSPVLFYRRAP